MWLGPKPPSGMAWSFFWEGGHRHICDQQPVRHPSAAFPFLLLPSHHTHPHSLHGDGPWAAPSPSPPRLARSAPCSTGRVWGTTGSSAKALLFSNHPLTPPARKKSEDRRRPLLLLHTGLGRMCPSGTSISRKGKASRGIGDVTGEDGMGHAMLRMLADDNNAGATTRSIPFSLKPWLEVAAACKKTAKEEHKSLFFHRNVAYRCAAD